MRRIGLIVAVGVLLGMLGGVATASPALARGPKWQIVDAQPFTLLAKDGYCGFDVFVSVPVNREYYKLLKTDGSVITLFTGSLTASFTNLDTGKTITENISGPYKVTASGDSAVVAFEGLTLFAITRDQAQQFRLPIVSVIAGDLTVSVTGVTFTSVSLQGHVLVDICAALS
jgi:hypothetical protein